MAASTIPPILIQLQADVTQLKAGLTQATNAIKGVDDNIKKTSTGMSNFVTNLKKVGAALGATFAATQVVAFAKQSVMAASNMEESLSKVRVVFGEGASEVEKFGASAAQNLGISNQAALEAAGTYGNLFQAFGLGQGEAQKMSTNLVQLAADMASFNNTSIDQAITALRSGLSGETEPLKRFGVALSEVRLKEEALRMGLIKTTSGTLPVAIKSQAAYALIMRDTALAQGDYSRTADGTANTMKTLQAKIEDAKVALGEALMPAFRAVLAVTNLLVPVLTKIGDFFKKNQDEVKAFAITVGVLSAAWGIYTLVVKRAAIQQAILNAVMAVNPIAVIVVAVGLLVAGFVKLYKSNETFRKAVIATAKVALQAFASIIPMVGQVFEVIMKVVTGPLRALLTVLSKLPGVGKYAKAGLEIMNKGLDGISDFANNAAMKAKILSEGLDRMGKAADKNAGKVDKATKGGKPGKGGVVDPAAAQAAADKAKELLEKRQEAEMSYIETSIKAHEAYQEKVADIQQKYNETVADAQADHTKEMVEAAKDYAKKKIEIEAELQSKITDLNKAAAEKRANLAVEATKKQASIIQQSVDRLRSAFASKTGFNLADSFSEGKSADALLKDLKNKLNAAKNLAENAAFLQANGFSQTFIEQVVSAGPEVGNSLAEAILNASPEAIKELQTTFNAVESTSNNGLNDLAKTMNAGGRLATQELMDAYSQVAVDLKDSLAEVDRELQVSLAEAQSAYDNAMNAAKIARDERMLEASTTLKQKLAEAQATMDAALADAQKTLQKALLDAQKAYEKAVDQVAASTAAKLAALKIQLAEVAAATAALQGAQAARSAAAIPNFTPYMTTTPTTPGSQGFIGPVAPSTTVNINGTNLTNPTATANSVVNAIKYGTTVNTTTLAGIMAASASKPSATNSMDIVAAARQRNGGYL
jgi:hypothetical protein